MSQPTPHHPIKVSFQVNGMVETDKSTCFWLLDGARRPTTEYVFQHTQNNLDILPVPDALESEDETLPPHSNTTHNLEPSLTDSNESLPDSLFPLNCCCGLVGDGNMLYQTVEGEAIQYDKCKDWSHFACQRDSRASGLKENELFLCDICLVRPFLPWRKSQWMGIKQQTGMGVLEWDVAYLLAMGSIGTLSTSFTRKVMVSNGVFDGGGGKDIVDSLWMDRTGRRTIRVGADVLKSLLQAPDDAVGIIPARTWLISTKPNLKSTLVPYIGSLTILERAHIANWFELHISQKPDLQQNWLGYLPIAHAHTLFISNQIKSDARFKDLSDDALLQKAWEIQFTGVPSIWTNVDVDHDSLSVRATLLLHQQ
ncbi:hypothetical protein BDZ94DRAFT_1315628 [Collybia nuda]|uniref:Uncharacterized protein n=1 Tax=Collybia nuda TaxID=64659 RepID=A0A9P5XSL7_9AGAR|nr:hypothetical protein BDZ94DRAFT_1315628 [Collybia nuda]